MKTTVNKIQKRIIAIISPLIATTITLGLTEKIFDKECSLFSGFSQRTNACTPLNVHWNYFEYTWWLWLILMIFTGVFEFWLFKDNK